MYLIMIQPLFEKLHEQFLNYQLYIKDKDLTTYHAMKDILFLFKHHSIKTHWGSRVHLHVFLTSALEGCEWWASHTGHLTPWKEPPVPIW